MCIERCVSRSSMIKVVERIEAAKIPREIRRVIINA